MPDMAIYCYEKLYKAGINIVGVVPPPPENPSYGFFTSYLKKYNPNIIPYEKSLKDPEFLKKIKALNADIAVVCSYNKLFPPEFLACAKDGFLNCHPSLLPDYRGANPYSHIIMNNERTSGMTIHFMNNSFDSGDIVLQKEFPMTGNETMGILFNAYNFIAADMLLEVLTKYEKDGKLPRVPQPIICNKPAPSIKNNFVDNRIDWTKSAKELECFVRALNPFIVAMSSFRNEMVKISNATFSAYQSKQKPGTVCELQRGLGIATGDGTLYLEIVQFGTYLICSGKELIQRIQIAEGEEFN